MMSLLKSMWMTKLIMMLIVNGNIVPDLNVDNEVFWPVILLMKDLLQDV